MTNILRRNCLRFDRILRTRLDRVSPDSTALPANNLHVSYGAAMKISFFTILTERGLLCYLKFVSSWRYQEWEQQTCRPYRLRRIQTVQHLKKWTHLEDKLLCTIEDKEKLTNRFNENRLVTGGFTHDYSLICGTSYTAQISAGRWWTNKGVHVSRKFLHSGFVAHQWSLKEENK